MCTGKEKFLIRQKLLPNCTYHGLFVRMPSGKHKFIGLYDQPIEDEEGLLPPMTAHNPDKALGVLVFKLLEAHRRNPRRGRLDGIFVEEICGTKDEIWTRKTELDCPAESLAA